MKKYSGIQRFVILFVAGVAFTSTFAKPAMAFQDHPVYVQATAEAQRLWREEVAGTQKHTSGEWRKMRWAAQTAVNKTRTLDADDRYPGRDLTQIKEAAHFGKTPTTLMIRIKPIYDRVTVVVRGSNEAQVVASGSLKAVSFQDVAERSYERVAAASQHEREYTANKD